MVKVTIYKTHDEANSSLEGLFLDNNKVIDAMGEIGDARREEDKEQEVEEIWKNVGEGLKFTYAIELSKNQGSYGFHTFDENSFDLRIIGMYDNSIEGLVGKIKYTLETEGKNRLGAKVDAIFYTVSEIIEVDEESRENLRNNIKDMPDEKDGFLSLIVQYAKKILSPENKSSMALNQEEIDKFERLYTQ